MSEAEPVEGALVWRSGGAWDCTEPTGSTVETDADGDYLLTVRDTRLPVFIRAFAESWWLDAYCFRVGEASYGPVAVQVWDGLPSTLVDCDVGSEGCPRADAASERAKVGSPEAD